MSEDYTADLIRKTVGPFSEQVCDGQADIMANLSDLQHTIGQIGDMRDDITHQFDVFANSLSETESMRKRIEKLKQKLNDFKKLTSKLEQELQESKLLSAKYAADITSHQYTILDLNMKLKNVSKLAGIKDDEDSDQEEAPNSTDNSRLIPSGFFFCFFFCVLFTFFFFRSKPDVFHHHQRHHHQHHRHHHC